MKRNILLILGIVVVVGGMVGSSMIFTVHQTQQVIVLQFGNPVRSITEPGLHFKLPWPFQDVLAYESRVLNLDPPVESIILSDQKRILVDAFARYRIKNAKVFREAVRNEAGVRQLLGPIVNASLRGVLGNATLADVLSEDRDRIMREIQDSVNKESSRFGIEIVDVRIGRADFPDQISQAVYGRMKSERDREAAEFRAQGFELSQRIRAGADREATVILAEAKREAEIARGAGEAIRTRVLNDAFGQDEDFFSFYRSMQAYEAAFTSETTYMVLSPDSEFFDFFTSIRPKRAE